MATNHTIVPTAIPTEFTANELPFVEFTPAQAAQEVAQCWSLPEDKAVLRALIQCVDRGLRPTHAWAEGKTAGGWSKTRHTGIESRSVMIEVEGEVNHKPQALGYVVVIQRRLTKTGAVIQSSVGHTTREVCNAWRRTQRPAPAPKPMDAYDRMAEDRQAELAWGHGRADRLGW